MIKLTREQKIHVLIHSTKGPALFMVGWFGASGILQLGISAMILFMTEIVTDMLYWIAINRRPRSGSPDFYQPRIPEPPTGPPDVPRCARCGHPCVACEIVAEMTANARPESGWGKE